MAGINETARLLATLELQDKFSGPARAAEGALGRLEGGFGRVREGLGQMGRGVGQIGHGLDQIATRAAIATVGIGTALITTAATMEQAFVGVQKTVDETASFSFEQLRQKLRELSSETGTAFEELSRIGEIGGALGVPIEDLTAFIDVVNRLGVSTDLSTDAAATALGQLATTLHLSGSEFESFADTLVALGNAGASTEPQIVELAARFAAAGNRAGLSSDEVLALASAVTSMGVEVEAGGTALSQTFNNIATAIGTGSDEVQGFTDVLGISAEEFRRRWETDALGTFQDFLQEIGKLDPIAQAVALDMAGITGQRQLNAVGLMADNWEFVAEQLGVANDAQGELREESDKFFGTTIAGFGKLRENVRLSAETIGSKLLPIVGDLTAEFLGWIQDPKTQQAIEDFGTNLAGGLRDFIAEVRKFDFGPLIGTLQGAASIAKGAFDAFRSLPQPIQQLALAAIVANKVTGGAVGSIASGLGNLLVGGLKIAFLDRGTVTNPMWVRQVGGIPGAPGGPGGGKFPLVPVLGALAAPLILSGSDAPNAEMSNKQIELTKQIEQGAITSAEAARLWSKAYGEITANPFKVEIPGLPKTGSGTVEWAKGLFGVTQQTGTSSWAQGLNKVEVALPDTAMQPLTTALGELTDIIRTTNPFDRTKTGTSEWAKALPGIFGNFVGSVELDPSRINDLRGDQTGTSDWAKGLNPVTTELGRVKSEVASQGSRQLTKQDALLAAMRDNVNVLRSKDYAPEFNLVANVSTNVSISEVQRKITSQNVALGVDPASSRAV